MPDDPIFEALRLGLPITPAVLEAATRYRQSEIEELQREIQVLATLRWERPSPEDVRAERDPPIETPERTYH